MDDRKSQVDLLREIRDNPEMIETERQALIELLIRS